LHDNARLHLHRLDTLFMKRSNHTPQHAPVKAGWLVAPQSGSAAWNMAFDETLLAAAKDFERPLLRFYGWTEPAASFGYFQHIADVEKSTLLRPLVRRPTGGGIVPHDADWTYSLAIPSTEDWYGLRASASYRHIHEWIQAALATLGVLTELASCCRKELPGQCFVGHEKDDLLFHGRKIAGAAQRRTQSGLLIQGSVQPPALPIARAAWERSMIEVAHHKWGTAWEPWSLPESWLEHVGDLTASKYQLATYNRQR
jgi:lipoate-protein ligase A